MRALIVDDEPLARSRLRRMLDRVGELTVCGEAENSEDALAKIRVLRPDVVFLDIRMPGRDGLKLALEERDLPPVIFTTAYDEFALAAFDAAAVDYLLKPIEEARLRKAIERLHRRSASADASGSVMAALEAALQAQAPIRVHARRGESVHVFDAARIVRFHAEDKYTAFTEGGTEYLCEESLNSLEERLRAKGFVRCHRAELIALSAVKRLFQEDGGFAVQLADGQVAKVSRRSVQEMRRLLGIAGG